MRERRRLVDVGDRELQLLGQVRDLLDDLAEGALHVAGERLELVAFCEHVGHRLDPGDEVRLLGDVVAQPHPVGGLNEDPDRAVGNLEHPRDDADDADVVELVGTGLLDLGVAGGDHHQRPLAGEDVVDELHRALEPDRERGQRVRVGNGVLQRQDRQRGGQRLLGPGADRLVEIGRLDHLDRVGHHSPGSIGTRRVTCPASGSSTRRIPSS